MPPSARLRPDQDNVHKVSDHANMSGQVKPMQCLSNVHLIVRNDRWSKKDLAHLCSAKQTFGFILNLRRFYARQPVGRLSNTLKVWWEKTATISTKHCIAQRRPFSKTPHPPWPSASFSSPAVANHLNRLGQRSPPRSPCRTPAFHILTIHCNLFTFITHFHFTT